MAFGQQGGPPATARQVQELLSLLQEVGHADFRDARGPMGFTQRQAGGKFTRDEADEFIEQLQDAIHDDDQTLAAATPVVDKPTPRLTAADRAVREMPDGLLAEELQRRGWIVVEP